jgi:hypothetical protein
MQSYASAAKLQGCGFILKAAQRPCPISGGRHLGSSSAISDKYGWWTGEAGTRQAITQLREGQGLPAPRQWSPVATARSGACGRVPQSWSCASRRAHLQFVRDTTWPTRCPAGIRKPQASCSIPRRTRALPDLATPRSHRFLRSCSELPSDRRIVPLLCDPAGCERKSPVPAYRPSRRRPRPPG